MMLWFWLGLIAASALMGIVLSRFGWPFELAASLLPQIGFVALLFSGCAFMLGRADVGLCALAAVALCGYGARELFEPPAPPIERRDVRVVWANVLNERQAFTRAMDLARAEGADIVMIAELPRMREPERSALSHGYPYHAGRGAMRGVNVALFSRTPLQAVEPFEAPEQHYRQSLAARVQTPAGPLQLLAVHPPVPTRPFKQRARDGTIAAAFARLRAADAPALLAGDFNTTSWSMRFRQGLASGGVERAGLGASSTWMAPLPILGLPIDHVFTANGAQASARVGPGIGSDHLPLIIDLQIAADTAAPAH
ncbi:MAG: endonuclease/exonuclease/phosphatase family protein [Hyphomonadaceae bacterium]